MGYRWIHFSGNHIEEVLGGKGIGEVWLFSLNETKNIYSLIEQTLSIGRTYSLNDEARMSAILYEILINIQQYVTQLHVASDHALVGIQHTAEHIRQNCIQPITLEDMAVIAGYSIHYFSRKFHQLMGKTPIEYLTESRILFSKQLLVTTNLTVKQIAQNTGFSQSSYYIQCFRKYEAMTPEEFRSMYKQQGSSPLMG